MYLRGIRIQNARQIRDLRLDFTHQGPPRLLTAVLGPNGTGKTTVLRSIAAALSGSRISDKLCSAAELRSIGEESLTIEVEVELRPGSPASTAYGVRDNTVLADWELQSSAGKAFFTSATESFRAPVVKADLISVDDIRDQGLPGWFVAGYGVGRTLPPPMASFLTSIPILGQLGSLFDSPEHGRLVATNFADILEDSNGFAKALRGLLAETQGLVPGFQSLELRGRGGVTSATSLVESRRFQVGADSGAPRVPASWLSHGYQSVLALLADLLGRAAVAEGGGKVIQPADLRGVLLIDEVDLHLHPSWQRAVLPALARAFPKLQIIASTHSPMVIADLRPEQVVVLDADLKRGVVASQPKEPPQLLTAAQLLATYFGVTSSRAGRLRALLRERDELRAQQQPMALSVAGRSRASSAAATRLQAIEKELLEAGIPIVEADGGGPGRGIR